MFFRVPASDAKVERDATTPALLENEAFLFLMKLCGASISPTRSAGSSPSSPATPSTRVEEGGGGFEHRSSRVLGGCIAACLLVKLLSGTLEIATKMVVQDLQIVVYYVMH